MPSSVALALYICCAVVVGLFFLLLFLFPLFRDHYYAKKTIPSYYKKVYRVALDNDFYLINCFKNKTADEEEFHIDHVLVGDKYFYCIRDRYYPGVIEAKETDSKWKYYQKKGRCSLITNPVYVNSVRVSRMSLMSGIDRNCFISIVLVNNDCIIKGLEMTSNDNYIVKLKDFPALIKKIESRNVLPLEPKAVAAAVKDFSKLNQYGKKED